jgi:hypothetical protein
VIQYALFKPGDEPERIQLIEMNPKHFTAFKQYRLHGCGADLHHRQITVGKSAIRELITRQISI